MTRPTPKQEGCCERCRGVLLLSGSVFDTCPCHISQEKPDSHLDNAELGNSSTLTGHTREEGWEKEFDRLFPFADAGRECCMEPTEPHDITFKSFIKSVREDAYEEGESSMLADFVGAEDLDNANTVSEVIEAIKKKAINEWIRENQPILGFKCSEHKDAIAHCLQCQKGEIEEAVREERERIADVIKRRFNGFGGTLGFTANDLLSALHKDK